MLLLDVDPLDLLPSHICLASFNGLGLVLELVFHIGLPGDTFLVDGNYCSLGDDLFGTRFSLRSGDSFFNGNIGGRNNIRVGENTLGDESTRDGGTIGY